MKFSSAIPSVLWATGAAPFVVAVFSVALGYLSGRASLEATLKNVVVAPFGALFMMVFFAIPVIAATGATAGATLVVRRFVTSSTLPLWAIALLSLAYIPIALGRYPNGDGGTMQSFVELGKATVASGVACWCIYAALRLWPRI